MKRGKLLQIVEDYLYEKAQDPGPNMGAGHELGKEEKPEVLVRLQAGNLPELRLHHWAGK